MRKSQAIWVEIICVGDGAGWTNLAMQQEEEKSIKQRETWAYPIKCDSKSITQQYETASI